MIRKAGLEPTPTPLPRTPARPAAAVPSADRYLSADMAQMLEDIERNCPGLLKRSDESPQPERREPISADMVTMVEDIERAEAAGRASAAPIVLLQEVDPASVTPEVQARLEELTQAHPHREPRGMTAAHLGLEGAEMMAVKAEAAAAKAAMLEAAVEGAQAGGLLLTGAFIGGAIGCGVVAGAMGIHGVREIHEGVREGNKEKILEGSGATILGVKSGATALSLAGHGASGVLGAVAHAAHAVVAPLGVVHGSIDTVVGGKHIVDGVRAGDRPKMAKGALEVGFGVSLIAASVGGGLPAVLVAGAFLAGKAGFAYFQHRKAS